MKKIIPILLVAILVLQCGLISFAEESGISRSADLSFMQYLGVISKDFTDNSKVTRLQLADTYMNMVMEGMRSEYMDIEIPFSDVPENAYATGFVSKVGIMNGVGNGLFMPDAPVTYQQMIKTIITFLGYHNQANSMGGYPHGYIAQAAQLGILIPGISGETPVTAGTLATTFKLALNVDVMRIVLFGGDEKWSESGKDYLEIYKQIYRSRGVITANHATDIYSDKTLGFYDIRLNDIFLMLGDGARELVNYPGYSVDVYYNYNDAGIPYVLSYEFCNNDVFEIDSADLQGLVGNTITYYEGRKTTSVALSDNVSIIYNSTFVSSYDTTTINPFKDSYLDGGLTLVDNNLDGIIDVVFVDAFDTFVVSEVRDGYIYNKYRSSEIIDTRHMNNENTYITNVFDEPVKLEEITKGSIISVSKNIDGVVKRIVVTIDTFSGTLEEVYRESEFVSYMLIDGIEYKCSKTLALNPDIDNIKPGEGISCFFNKNGEISDIDLSSFDKYLYGYLVDSAYEGNGVLKQYKVKIFTDGNKMAVFPLAKKVMHNKESQVTDEQMYNLFGTDPESGKIIRQGIKYELNNDNEISGICLADTQLDPDASGEKNDVFFRFPGFDGTTEPETAYRGSVNGFSGKLLFSNSTRTFLVPPESDRYNDDKYKIVTVATIYYDNYQRTPCAAYGSNSRSSVAEMIVVDSSKFGGGTTVTSQIVTFVNKINKTVNEEGDVKYKLYGILNGSETTILIDESNMIDDLEIGDIIVFTKNAEGEAEGLQKIFDKGNMRFVEGIANPNIDAYSGNGRMTFGKVVYGDDYHFTIEITKDDGTKILNSYPYGKFKCGVYYEEFHEPLLVKATDSQYLKNDYQHPGQASYVFTYTMGGDALYMMIYND